MEDALAFYRGVLGGQDDPDPEARLDAALARVEVASLEYGLGRAGPAAENFRLAVDQLEALPDPHRSGRACRMALIQCYNHLAHLPGPGGDAEGEAWLRQARAEAEAITAPDPTDPSRRNLVATSEHNLGSFFQLRGRNDVAEPHYLRAVEIRTEVTNRDPSHKGYRVDLAEDLLNLGLIYSAARRDAAADAFRRSEGLLRPLVEADPGHERYALSLAGLYVNWGSLLRFSGDLAGATAKFERAVELADAVRMREPEYATARLRAAQAHGSRALALADAGRYAEAAADWDVAVELVEPSQRARYRRNRADVLARAGQHRSATAEAGELAANPASAGDTLYNLACVYALSIGPALSDPEAGFFTRTATAERYAFSAVALLRRLHADGYFRRADSAQHLRLDPDLWPLHHRPDFRRLLDDVAGGPKP
jgi:tetratricopeptide (TPR) repeat protein